MSRISFFFYKLFRCVMAQFKTRKAIHVIYTTSKEEKETKREDYLMSRLHDDQRWL